MFNFKLHPLFFIFLWSSSVCATLIEAPRVPLSFVQNPSGIHWKSIGSEHFDVIYPEGFAQDAQLVLSALDAVYFEAARSLDITPRKIPIILQPHTLNSNGFVTLAPRRSEFFVTPYMGPSLGQTEWLRTLALHEYRHVVQFEKSQKGFAKALYIIMGEIGSALAMGLTIPPWYFEGDAVGIETALTRGGRGRLPLFERELRALVLDGQSWSYDQMSLGSFKRYSPNHYVLGFFLTTYLRKHFGADVLERIHSDSMERAYNPLAFYWACERHTGLKIDEIFKRTLSELSLQWAGKEVPAVHDVNKDWVNYSYPLKVDDKIFAFRQSLSDILQFVEVGQVDRVLWTPTPLVQDFPFKTRKGKIAYAQTALHPRFGNQDYSTVIVRDLNQQKIIFEMPRSRWTLPVLSHQADRLAFVEWTQTGEVFLGVWNLTRDESEWQMPWPRHEAIVGLDWSDDGASLILLHKKGTYTHQFVQLNFDTKELRPLLQTEQWAWGYPVVYQNQVYFQSPQTGVDNIFRLNLATLEVQQVTDDPIGAYHPHLDHTGLTYVSYTAAGQKIKSQPWPLEIYSTTAPSHSYARDITQIENKKDVFEQLELKEVKEVDYPQASNAFNPHSWLLLAPPFSSTINAEIRSTNLLNTLNLGAGAQWDLNERVPKAYAFTQWQYLWPVVDFQLAYGNRRLDEDFWEEGTSSLGVTLPFRSLHGGFTHTSSFRLGGELLHAAARQNGGSNLLKDESLAGASFEWRSSFLHRQAQRDLLPPWGVVARARGISLKDLESPGATNHQALYTAQFYTTPILKHHHLYLESSVQENSPSGYRFSSFQLFPRGVRNVFLEKSTKHSVNYLFPLLYPEWSVGEWFYLKRLSLNLFYDQLTGERLSRHLQYESRGVELWLDSHFVRNAFGIQWGVRYSLPKNDEANFELFLNTGLASF
jgi:hypothetical protein